MSHRHPRDQYPEPRTTVGDKPLLGRNILILEDEVLLAMDLQYSLEEYGVSVVGPAHSIADGLRLVADGNIDAAILDVDLNGQEAFPVAHRLDEVGVPFLFHTGHATREQLKALFPDVMVCHKPTMISDIVERLGAIITD